MHLTVCTLHEVIIRSSDDVAECSTAKFRDAGTRQVYPQCWLASMFYYVFMGHSFTEDFVVRILRLVNAAIGYIRSHLSNGGSSARVWDHMVNAELEPITRVKGQNSHNGGQGAESPAGPRLL